jgi:hypothetical protein
MQSAAGTASTSGPGVESSRSRSRSQSRPRGAARGWRGRRGQRHVGHRMQRVASEMIGRATHGADLQNRWRDREATFHADGSCRGHRQLDAGSVSMGTASGHAAAAGERGLKMSCRRRLSESRTRELGLNERNRGLDVGGPRPVGSRGLGSPRGLNVGRGPACADALRHRESLRGGYHFAGSIVGQHLQNAAGTELVRWQTCRAREALKII